jgi:four helix bundle protein
LTLPHRRAVAGTQRLLGRRHCCFCDLGQGAIGTFRIGTAGCGGNDAKCQAAGDGKVRALAIWMAKEIDERAFALGLRVITLRRDEEYQRIVRWKVIGQLVDAATSVGANLSEASAAQSKPDFVAKVSVSKKEAFETQFWLRLIDEAKVLGDIDLSELRSEASSVGRIVSAIARRAKESGRRGPADA